MATEQLSRRAAHLRSVTVTSLSSLAGIAAGLLSAALVGSTPAAATDQTGLFIFVGAVLIQFGILPVLGVDVSEFSTKDYLYVGFMTFSLWFVTWAILLTSGTQVTF